MFIRPFAWLLLLALAPCALAQPKPAAKPDPVAVLAAAKEASGGAAWDALRTQRSEVKLLAANLEGSVERWSDIATGRSLIRYRIGPISGAAGNDGKQVWTQEESEEPKVETGATGGGILPPAWRTPHATISRTSGRRSSPFCVSTYSIRGGRSL